jgi:uncharacterized protein (TIGR00369 family)
MNDLAAIQRALDETPFSRLLGIRCVSWTAEPAALTCEMTLQADFTNSPSGNAAHGGTLCALIDNAVTHVVVAKGLQNCTTANLRVDFLRPAAGARLRCVAVIRRLGRTAAIVDADVSNDSGTLVAIGRASIAILSV